MKRLSHEAKYGFTLAELLVASAASSLIIASICGIYFSIAKEWQRQQGEANSLIATSQACSRLSDYISQSTSATVIDRFNTGDSIVVTLPIDTAHGNTYIPIWSDNKVQYRSGNYLVFYLSDANGSYNNTGNMLWAASVTWNGYTWVVNPDRAWSLYYNSSNAKISPLKSVKFTLNSSQRRPKVTITAISAYTIGSTEKQLTQTRTVCLRNTN